MPGAKDAAGHAGAPILWLLLGDLLLATHVDLLVALQHGIPRNPHDPGHYTGASSSGSAAAVAAGLCPFAIGESQSEPAGTLSQNACGETSLLSLLTRV